jgi:hypothetical protein
MSSYVRPKQTWYTKTDLIIIFATNLILDDGDTTALHLEHGQQGVASRLNGHCVSILVSIFKTFFLVTDVGAK